MQVATSLGVQLFVGNAVPLPELLEPIKNDPDAYYRQKPHGGFWTSTYRKETHDSAWIEWCRGEEFGDVDKLRWHLLTPRPDCKIYTIDSRMDFKRLLKTHGLVPPIAHMHSFFADKLTIDFEKLAQEYDGLHLTSRGNGQTHLSYPNDLNAWDCESILWFRWCFTEVQQVQPVEPPQVN